jgi:hypothetical protein
MDIDDEMLAQLFMQEENTVDIRRHQQQLMLASLIRLRQLILALAVPRRGASRVVTRWLLDNAQDEGLRVSESLHVSTRHRILDKRGTRFTQVWDARRGNTLTSCLSHLDYG